MRAYFSLGSDISFRRVSLLSANSLPERYVYSTSNPDGRCPSFLIQALSSERGSVLSLPSCFTPTPMNELSRRTHNALPVANHCAYTLISKGSKSVSVFINVQAITSILAAILTRILVLMPRSFSRPSRYRVNNARNRSLW